MKNVLVNYSVCALVLFSSCSTLMASEQRTSIVLGTEDWPPYSYAENKQIIGISTEIINATLARMGVSITKNKVYPWIRAQTSVFTGKIDAVYTASINAERMVHCYFPAEPIISSKWVLFIKKSNQENLNFNQLSDLNDKRFGFIKGYNYPADFKNYVTKHSEIQEASRELPNIIKLLKGRYEYMPAVLETTLFLAKNDPKLIKMNAINELYYFPKLLATTNFYLMFSKKTVKKEFVTRFSAALSAFKHSDEYQKIVKKYL